MKKDKTYLALVIDLLKVDDFYGVSEIIDVAKGKNELPDTWKGMINTIKRNK